MIILKLYKKKTVLYSQMLQGAHHSLLISLVNCYLVEKKHRNYWANRTQKMACFGETQRRTLHEKPCPNCETSELFLFPLVKVKICPPCGVSLRTLKNQLARESNTISNKSDSASDRTCLCCKSSEPGEEMPIHHCESTRPMEKRSPLSSIIEPLLFDDLE